MSDVSHPAPGKNRVGLWALLFGACAAPIFWLGQMMLGYGVTAYTCYPADHPRLLVANSPLFGALVGFDVVAIAACIAGGAVSWWAWQRTKGEKQGSHHDALHIGEGRTRFMALWGLMSSLWFFCAILFNTIASIMVPPCLS